LAHVWLAPETDIFCIEIRQSRFDLLFHVLISTHFILDSNKVLGYRMINLLRVSQVEIKP